MKKVLKKAVAAVVVCAIIVCSFPLFRVNASGIPDFQYNEELGGFYMTLDGVRYIVGPGPDTDEMTDTMAVSAFSLPTATGAEIEVRIYSPYEEGKKAGDPDYENYDPSQIFVDLWVKNITTACGAVGLWYNPSIVVPSSVDGNQTLDEEASLEYDDFIQIPPTLVFSDDPDVLAGGASAPAFAPDAAEDEVDMDNEPEELPEEEEEAAKQPETEPPEGETAETPPEDGEGEITAFAEPYTTVYLDDLFVPYKPSTEPGGGIGSTYEGMDLASNYIALQYWTDDMVDRAVWDTLTANNLSANAQGNRPSRQLRIYDQLTAPTGEFDDGLVMARLSFKLVGESLTFSSFNKSNLRYTDTSTGETVAVYIQDGAMVQWPYLPATTDAELIYFRGLPYPPPPYEPRAVNNGDGTVTIYVPSLSYNQTDADAESVPEHMKFNVYFDAPGADKLDDTYISNYEYNIDGDPDPTLKGAKFTITLPPDTDPAYDTLSELIDIIEKGGTLHLSSVYHGIESKTVVDPEDESMDTLFTVPVTVYKAIEYTGTLISWAPNHEAKLSLYRYKGAGLTTDEENYEADPAFTLTLMDTDISDGGQWEQTFRFASSDLAGTYMLVIEKPSHVTYTEPGLVIASPAIIEPGAPGYDPDDPDYRQSAPEGIRLFCGDVNGDGMIKQQDRSYLVDYVNSPTLWRGSIDDVTDPEKPLFLMDLDGDGQITILDLNILMHEDNFNKCASDYHSGP